MEEKDRLLRDIVNDVCKFVENERTLDIYDKPYAIKDYYCDIDDEVFIKMCKAILEGLQAAWLISTRFFFHGTKLMYQ